MRWFPVLMTHASGRLQFKRGNLRGLTSPKEIEELQKRGLIGSEVLLPEDAKAAKTNPTEVVTENSGEDKAREILNQAARSAWKPGMELPTPKRHRKARAAAADVSEASEEDRTLAALAEAEQPKPARRGQR
jgi:hypothetical protein